MEDGGLPQAGNHTMIKDAHGFLWIGSGLDGFGFSRFDGARFRKYLPDPKSHNTINSDQIFSFTEDSLNNIWIGTTKGISRYDFKADTFTNFIPTVAPKSLSKKILPFWATKKLVYCLESGLHIVVYNIYSLRKDTLLSLNESDNIQPKYIILDTLTQCLWILAHNEHTSGGLLSINLTNRIRQSYSWPCYRNIP